MNSTQSESYKSYQFKNLTVSFQDKHNGGGVKWAPEFVEHAQALGLKPKRVLEYCCGPGFIGFSLLEGGFGEELLLVDINPAVEKDINLTLENNPDFQDKTRFKLATRLAELAGEESFDLIVANPPHVNVLDPNAPRVEFNDPPILYSDPSWQIHKNLFEDAAKLLAADGALLLVENGTFSSLSDFLEMGVDFEMQELPASREDFYFIYGTPRKVTQ